MKLQRTFDIQVYDRYYRIPFPLLAGFLMGVVVLVLAFALHYAFHRRGSRP